MFMLDQIPDKFWSCFFVVLILWIRDSCHVSYEFFSIGSYVNEFYFVHVGGYIL